MPSTVLIADDNPHIVSGVVQLLENSPLIGSLLFAQDGHQAVESVRVSLPDLVILDLSMPVMDGMAAAREIRKLSPHIPIILFTLHDYALRVNPATLYSSGISAVVSKEEATSKLLTAVECLLQKGA